MPLYFKNNAHLNSETPKNLVREFCVDTFSKQNLMQKGWDVVINGKSLVSQILKNQMIKSGIVIGKFFLSKTPKLFPFSNILFPISKNSQLWAYSGEDFLTLLHGLFRFAPGQLSLQPYPASESF